MQALEAEALPPAGTGEQGGQALACTTPPKKPMSGHVNSNC